MVLAVVIGCNKPAANISFNKLLKSQPYTVLMFIAPDCPLCKTLSTPYKELALKYPEIQFLAVHSGENYESMEINMFATENNFDIPIFRDYYYEVAHQFKATITPEFIVVDSAGQTHYQGLLDDRILDLGSYKQQWSKHHLVDALEAITNDNTPAITKTDAVGCVLEY